MRYRKDYFDGFDLCKMSRKAKKGEGGKAIGGQVDKSYRENKELHRFIYNAWYGQWQT